MSVSSVKVMPRWIPLLGGVLGSTTCGLLLYAWSVFIQPLSAEFGWSRAEISMAFSICALMFGLATFISGRMSDRFGPRIVVIIGSIILGTGFTAAGYIDQKWQLYLAYGFIAGTGGGLVYLPPIATAPKWWPDRRALATGFAVVGLGLGSFIMAPLATKIIGHPDLGWRYVFIYVGIAMGTMGLMSAFCLSNPPPKWKPASWNPLQPTGTDPLAVEQDFTFNEAVSTYQFWVFYLAFFCGCFAGLMVIGHVAGHGTDSGLTSMQAAMAVSALAVCNAVTRVVIGYVADRIGAKMSLVLILAVQVAALLLLYPAGSNVVFLVVIAALIGWNYGGMFTLFPSTCLQYYGARSQGANYGLLFTAFGLAGFLGPLMGGILKDSTGTYSIPFITGAAVVAVSAVTIALSKAPARKVV